MKLALGNSEDARGWRVRIDLFEIVLNERRYPVNILDVKYVLKADGTKTK